MGHKGGSRAHQFWNGRPIGLPGAGLEMFIATGRAVADRLSTWLRVRNLGAAGPGVLIQAGTVIRHPGQVELGARSSIGRRTVLGTERPDGRLRIGPDTKIDRDCHLDFTGLLEIGAHCTISANARLYTHDHGRDPRSEPEARHLRIGDGVWIGAGSTVLPNVGEIGEGSLVAANSVVIRRVPPGMLVGGNPAQELGPASDGDPSRREFAPA